MKVLIVTTSYPTHEEDAAGHFVRAEARQLMRSGHDVHVVAPLPAIAQSPSFDGSIAIHHVGHASLFGWPGAIANAKTNPLKLLQIFPFLLAARRRIAQISNVDRVIGHWIIPAGVPLLVDHPAPLEVVAHGADVRLLCALPSIVRTQIIQLLLDRQTKFRFVASASFQTLRAKLSPTIARRLDELSIVEPAAIEVPDVSARAAQILNSISSRSTEFVVAVGRLIELKRFDLAIAAAARTGLPLVIVGDGPLRKDLERLAADLKAPVSFLGQRERKEALAWIAASRVLVHPSRAEAAPTVVREARALGIPVVATAVGDIAMWANKDLGIVVTDPREEALASAIKAVFSTARPGDEKSSGHDDR